MHYSRLPALLLVIVIALFCMTPVNAQTPAATPESGSQKGLQEAVSRQYGLPANTKITQQEGLSFLTARIYRFDTPEHAASAYDDMIINAGAQIAPPDQAASIEIHTEGIDELGDQAEVSWLQANPAEGVQGFFRVLHVQDGELVYLLTAIAGDDESTLITDDLARDIASREPGTSAASFNPDGSSTGGLWDLFPNPDAEIISDLVPFADDHFTAP